MVCGSIWWHGNNCRMLWSFCAFLERCRADALTAINDDLYFVAEVQRFFEAALNVVHFCGLGLLGPLIASAASALSCIREMAFKGMLDTECSAG